MATVNKNEAGTWDFECGLPRCGFTSSNWPTKALAEERRTRHNAEHEGQEPEEDSPPLDMLVAAYGKGDDE